MYVIPNPERKIEDKSLEVLNPVTNRPIDKLGEYVTESLFWLRRLREKDIIKIQPEKISLFQEAKKSTEKRNALLSELYAEEITAQEDAQSSSKEDNTNDKETQEEINEENGEITDGNND